MVHTEWSWVKRHGGEKCKLHNCLIRFFGKNFSQWKRFFGQTLFTACPHTQSCRYHFIWGVLQTNCKSYGIKSFSACTKWRFYHWNFLENCCFRRRIIHLFLFLFLVLILIGTKVRKMNESFLWEHMEHTHTQAQIVHIYTTHITL